MHVTVTLRCNFIMLSKIVNDVHRSTCILYCSEFCAKKKNIFALTYELSGDHNHKLFHSVPPFTFTDIPHILMEKVTSCRTTFVRRVSLDIANYTFPRFRLRSQQITRRRRKREKSTRFPIRGYWHRESTLGVNREKWVGACKRRARK